MCASALSFAAPASLLEQEVRAPRTSRASHIPHVLSQTTHAPSLRPQRLPRTGDEVQLLDVGARTLHLSDAMPRSPAALRLQISGAG